MENLYKIKNIYESDRKRPITFRATKRYEKKISATYVKYYQETKDQDIFVK